MSDELAAIARLLLIYGVVCLLFGAMAGHLFGPGLVRRARRLVRRPRR